MKRSNPPLFSYERCLRAGVAISLIIGIILFAFGVPQENSRIPTLPCGIHAITGLPCPFCGGTRALRDLLCGNWQHAIYLNAIAFPTLFILCGATGILLLEAASGWRFAPWRFLGSKILRSAPWLIITVIFMCWIPHLLFALSIPKPELVDLKNPIAAKLRSLFYQENSDQ